MPAYDRPITIRTQPLPHDHTSVGAVLKFTSTDVARVQAWLDRAAEAGIIERATAQSYNGTYGGPVWYIP